MVRIWAIVPSDFSHRSHPKLTVASDQELIAALTHANGWHRHTASRLIYEKFIGSERRSNIADAIRRNILAASPIKDEHAVAALSLLAALDELTEDDVLPALNHPNAHLRCLAIQLAEPNVANHAYALATTVGDERRFRAQGCSAVGFRDRVDTA